MPQYKEHLRDRYFVMNDVRDYQKHYSKLPCAENATPDMVDAILGECAKFCEQVLSPLNQTGDQEGCQFEDGKVTTPKGFKEAYDLYSHKLVPQIGKAIAGDEDSYRYLIESIRRFPNMADFERMIRSAGFENTRVEPIMGGLVAIHSGWKV